MRLSDNGDVQVFTLSPSPIPQVAVGDLRMGNCSSESDGGPPSMQPVVQANQQPPSPGQQAPSAMASVPEDMHPALKAEFIDSSPPVLVERALSMPFLLASVGKAWPIGHVAVKGGLLAFEQVPKIVSELDDLPELPACSDGRALRDLKVWEVAEFFIKPATCSGVCSYVQVSSGAVLTRVMREAHTQSM